MRYSERRSRLRKKIKESNSNSKAYPVIRFCGALTIVFIILRMLGIIAWNLWWIFAPLWIPVGLAIVILALTVVIVMGLDFMRKTREKNKQKNRKVLVNNVSS